MTSIKEIGTRIYYKERLLLEQTNVTFKFQSGFITCLDKRQILDWGSCEAACSDYILVESFVADKIITSEREWLEKEQIKRKQEQQKPESEFVELTSCGAKVFIKKDLIKAIYERKVANSYGDITDILFSSESVSVKETYSEVLELLNE